MLCSVGKRAHVITAQNEGSPKGTLAYFTFTTMSQHMHSAQHFKIAMQTPRSHSKFTTGRYGGQFALSTQLINPNFCVSLPHRRSTTVSLETNPLVWNIF